MMISNRAINNSEEEKSCSMRVYACCCCIPLKTGTVLIAIVVLLEAILSALLRDPINLLLQVVLLIILLVGFCKRHSERVRSVVYQAYGVVLILNLVYIVSFIVIFFFTYDVVEELCEDYVLGENSADNRINFNSVEACHADLQIAAIAIIVPFCLIYVPIKLHFFLVLREMHFRKAVQQAVLMVESELQQMAQMSPSPRRARNNTPELLGAAGNRTDNTNDYGSVAPVSARSTDRGDRGSGMLQSGENFAGLPEPNDDNVPAGIDIVDEEIRERSGGVVKLPPIDLKRSAELIRADLITPSGRL